MLGANPAPPPIIKALAAKTAEVAQVVALEKYGMPPLVPATVSASVPDPVIGEPPTEMMPPVKVWDTDVTVPVVGVAQEGMPAAKVSTWPFDPAAKNAVVLAAL